MNKREFDPEVLEWMDRPDPDPVLLERDLANLRWLNRHFGNYRVIRKRVEPWLMQAATAKDGTVFRVLDLATGSGDVSQRIVDLARSHGLAIQVVAVDASEQTLAVAKNLAVDYPEIEFVRASALDLPASLQRFDLVMCTLALHHFSDEDAVLLLRTMHERSRRRVLVTDLWRNRLAMVGIWLLTATILREPVTREDARLSIRRAFAPEEIRELAKKAGWQQLDLQSHPPAWQSLAATK